MFYKNNYIIFLVIVGDARLGLKWFRASLTAPLYVTVFYARHAWYQERQLFLQAVPEGGSVLFTTHYFTVASENTDELKNLLFSAEVADVFIQVLGLGKEYLNYYQKIEWYVEAIARNDSIKYTDVIVLMDAYDVIVTPGIKHIGRQLAAFDTPIVYCAENGLYPDPSSNNKFILYLLVWFSLV